MRIQNFLYGWIWLFCGSGILQAQYATRLTVAKDGTGDYTSIQAAINDAKAFPDEPITIVIRPGIYEEKVRVYPWNTRLTLEGADAATTIIRFQDHFSQVDLGRNSTFHTWTLSVEANDVTLRNLSIVNSAGPVGQALALYISGDRCVVERCVLKGYQDTLYCSGEGSRQYFRNCTIEGTTDFIFGNATAVFDSCTLHSLADSYITAASTTPQQTHGFVFTSCQLTAAPGVNRVFLGRPWRQFAKTVFLNCTYGPHIAPEGWQLWSNEGNPETVFYAEFSPSPAKGRVPWSKQLSQQEVKHYSLPAIFRDWLPHTSPSPTPLPLEIPLYTGSIPGNLTTTDQGKSEQRGPKGGLAYFDTTHPSLTVYQPPVPNGKAIVVCPGGGYVRTAFEKEGTRVAERLLRDSITVFVLKYRLPNPGYQSNPALAPLQDAQTAIQWVRQQASYYGIQPNSVGIMGFSAGGHLAASAATRFLPDSTNRPDFVVLVYPVISFSDSLTHQGSRERLLGKNPNPEAIFEWSAEHHVQPDGPPVFLVHAGDDRSVPVGNSLAFYQACIQKGIPAEMHLYPRGGHGFGLVNPTTSDDWTARLSLWLQRIP